MWVPQRLHWPAVRQMWSRLLSRAQPWALPRMRLPFRRLCLLVLRQVRNEAFGARPAHPPALCFVTWLCLGIRGKGRSLLEKEWGGRGGVLLQNACVNQNSRKRILLRECFSSFKIFFEATKKIRWIAEVVTKQTKKWFYLCSWFILTSQPYSWMFRTKWITWWCLWIPCIRFLGLIYTCAYMQAAEHAKLPYAEPFGPHLLISVFLSRDPGMSCTLSSAGSWSWQYLDLKTKSEILLLMWFLVLHTSMWKLETEDLSELG